MSLTLPPIAILGAGSMGGAILQGLLAPEVQVEGGIRVTNRTEVKAAALQQEGVTSYATESDPDANARAVDGARLVVLGVKPFGIADLLRELAPVLDPAAVVVSVAAGVRLATMEELVPNPVLRAMPNTPSLVRLGVTGLSAGSRVSETDAALARSVFECVGSVLGVPEEQLDALSAVSGSGPAYVYLLIEQLELAARNLGFTAEQAQTMVRQTFRGATELLAATGEEPRELRRKVTSPKGTTEQAIAVMERADFAHTFDEALAAAIRRAGEIAAGK
ncbi:pyrroline-5-carboxylate reductase [Herbiconiux sp. SYSU D00978]|uniref:pyrroline-5-carboxylate reductase n=1 Tax=Herbiconiux sp. SYSU D00978 TaxID=2812562 RepID=UPI001A975F21|nr:pyrroline-5-carboxylate reductase [Herbiconiux sp. SYSU D00978]